MKALNLLEVENVVEFISDELAWGQLQDLWSYETGLVLQFWKGSEKFLILDMSSDVPFAGLFERSPFKKNHQKTPLELFLRAHGKNLFFKKIETVPALGRYFKIFLGPRNENVVECLIEVSLVPRGGENVKASANGKKSFWKRPSPLSEMSSSVDLSQLDVRSLPELQKKWLQKTEALFPQKKTRLLMEGGSSSSTIFSKSGLTEKEKLLEKKKQALNKMSADAVRFTKRFGPLGAEIKNRIHEVFTVSKFCELTEKFDLLTVFEIPKEKSILEKKDLLKFMKVLFEKDREQKKKFESYLKRKILIEAEIRNIELIPDEEFQKSRVQEMTPMANLKVRKLALSSGPVAYFGKSAEDNLRLLREARAWDLWLHLVDYPSRHVVVRRNKNQSLKPSELDQICQKLIEETRGRDKLYPGAKFEVLFAECRFVRPLKGVGNKGKVTYSNEKRIFFVYN